MTFARFAIPALVLLTTATGCELIAAVDADKIKDNPTTTASGSGGTGGDSSSTTGTGGTGGATTGTGGAGGTGGATTGTGGAGGAGGATTGTGGAGGATTGTGGAGGTGGATTGTGGAGGATSTTGTGGAGGATTTGTGGAGGTATGTGGAGGATSTTSTTSTTGTGGAGGATTTTTGAGGAGGAGGTATGTGGAGGAPSTTGAGGAGGATTSTTSTTSGAGGSGGTTTTTTTTGGGGLVVDGGACAEDEQCESQVCASDVCQAPSCVDGVQNGDESDVDCGLTCAGDDPLAYCPSGATCVDNDDCYNAHCVSGVCAVSAEGDLCLSDADCDSGLTCDSGATGTCVGPAPITSCANGLTNQVVLSQVYGAGGMGLGAAYGNDFIELHNRGGAAVSLAGWSVQYTSAAGSTWTSLALSGSIDAGGFYLIQLGASATPALPTADATVTANLDNLNGKVALVSSTTAVTGACPSDSTLVDMVGYGPSASVCPGVSGNSGGLTGGASVYRKEKNVACLDTNAGTDFATAFTITARNSATTPVVCVNNCTSTPTP